MLSNDWDGTCDPYVQLQYDQKHYTTDVVYNSAHPIWQKTFMIPENSSMMTRRVRLEVWDRNEKSIRDAGMGFAVINLDTIAEGEVQVIATIFASRQVECPKFVFIILETFN